MTDELPAAEFAELATGRVAVVRERDLLLVREDALPDDWSATTVDCYSTESRYYQIARYDHTEPLKAHVNRFAADRLLACGAETVLDVGVGDGHRVATICALVAAEGGRAPRMYGVELSEPMIELARRRGVHTLHHDMREGLPDLGEEMGGVLFLSGDLGYLMDARDGPVLRARMLASAHARLRAGGCLVLELITRDPRPAPGGADVFHFSRQPVVRDEDDGRDVALGPVTWQFIKTFTREEAVALLASSPFDPASTAVHYVVRDSPDLGRIGRKVEDGDIVPEESYRLLLSAVK